MKTKILAATLTVIAFIIASIIMFGYFVEPIDPFLREYKSVKCLDSSLSIIAYRRKTGWLSFETEISVRVFDNEGKMVHEEVLGRFDMWTDSPIQGEALQISLLHND